MHTKHMYGANGEQERVAETVAETVAEIEKALEVRLSINYTCVFPIDTCERDSGARARGGTPMHSVFRSSSSVKMKVKGQSLKKASGQKSSCLLAGQESTSHFT